MSVTNKRQQVIESTRLQTKAVHTDTAISINASGWIL